MFISLYFSCPHYNTYIPNRKKINKKNDMEGII